MGFSYPNVIKEITISNDGKTILTLSFEGDLSLLTLKESKLIPYKDEFKINIEHNPSITFSYDDKYIFIGYLNGSIYRYPISI